MGWIDMKFCSDIYEPQKMNLTDFGDPVTSLYSSTILEYS